MERVLNATERRVLGVLIEKALSQPEYYPMTSNAIVAGCNQRLNRSPVMTLDEHEVLGTLDVLRKRGVVVMALAAPGARTNRYKHDVESHFGWNKRQQAIMAELLLRGPQTPGELRSRCTRMFALESLEAVMIALGSLGEPSESGPAVVAAMPRESGQSAVRYTHLLYPEDEAPTAGAVPAAASAVPAKPQAATPVSAPPTGEVDALRSEIRELRAEVADLRRRLDALEGGNSAS